MKKISVLMVVMVIGILVSSCSTRLPGLKDPEKGIVAVPVKASNTSTLGMSHYFKIHPQTNPEFAIKVFPTEGATFAFSQPLPPGEYNFDRIRILTDIRHVHTTRNYDVRKINFNYLKVWPGTVTIMRQRLNYKQVSQQLSWGASQISSNMEWWFDRIHEEELLSLIRELRNNDSNNQWKIANEP